MVLHQVINHHPNSSYSHKIADDRPRIGNYVIPRPDINHIMFRVRSTSIPLVKPCGSLMQAIAGP
jgi:hypothetical protein